MSEERPKISFGYKKIAIVIAIAAAVVTGSFIFIALQEIEEAASEKKIILATTTSTYDSGLLDYLLPKFEKQEDIEVKVLSVGTGQALEIGQKGDCDVLLVHARTSEDDFINNDYGKHRTCVMYNDFIIVGPFSDPASIDGENITVALANIKSIGEGSGCKFYSRGDDSGTHKKELALWDSELSFTPDPGSPPDNLWYFETGQGMGDTLIVADNNDGYTLVDRGTWLSAKDSLSLELHVEGDEVMLNPYGAILINNELHSHVKYESAKKFIGFLVSEKGQELIGDYRKNNEVLFHPCFGNCSNTHSCPTESEEVKYWKQYNGGYLGPASASILLTDRSLITSIL